MSILSTLTTAKQMVLLGFHFARIKDHLQIAQREVAAFKNPSCDRLKESLKIAEKSLGIIMEILEENHDEEGNDDD